MYRPYSSSQADSRPFRDVESQVRDLTQDFATSFNTGNYDQAAALFVSDGVLMAPRQEAAYGQKAVEHLLRRLGEAGYSDLRLETMRVEHSGDMAMELGRFTVAVRQGDGKLIPERGKYVKVWKRLGAWLVMADSWSGAHAASERAA
ncbi:MAG: YybH family protein [Candidatus Sulfotelmatobacter sp.]